MIRERAVLGAALTACSCLAPGAQAEAFLGLCVLCTLLLTERLGEFRPLSSLSFSQHVLC